MESETFPILYRKTANGAIYFWKININKDNKNDIYLVVQHGIHKGKLKTSSRQIIKTGRENTLYEKGIKTAEKKWKDKKNKEGYFDNFEEIETNIPFVTPMLAKKLIINKKTIKGMTFPLNVQPKLDGFRCRCSLVDGEIKLFSRNNLPYKGLQTLKNELLQLYSNNNNNLHLDGELYIPDIPFEILSGLIKRSQNHIEYDIKNIEFRIFDCFDLNNLCIEFKDRIKLLKSIISNEYKNIKYVRTEIINNLDEFKKYFSLFMVEGYEGIMVRNPLSPYEISKRSSHLQKYKEFSDSEFEIIGFHEGNGVDKGTVIWKCQTINNKKFNVRPKGSLEHRKQLFANANNCLGKMLTVKYQELSEQGVPRFPVGKDIRIQ